MAVILTQKKRKEMKPDIC